MHGISHLLLLVALSGDGAWPPKVEAPTRSLAHDEGWTRSYRLMGELRGGGRRAESAIFGLARCDDPFMHVHLRALFEDRVSARALVGDVEAEVPMRLRIAAGVALGIHGHPAGLCALRHALHGPRSFDPRLADAAVAGLAFSPFDVDRASWRAAAVDPGRGRARRHVAIGLRALAQGDRRRAGACLGRFAAEGGLIRRFLRAPSTVHPRSVVSRNP